MKWQNLLFALAIVIIFPPRASALLDVPQNIVLSSTDTTIIVEWNGDNDADGFYVYWGTSSSNLSQRAQVDHLVETYTITGLTPGTEYFVGVSAFDNSEETDMSDILSVTTTADNTAPGVPTGLGVTDISNITADSAILKWNQNTEPDLDHYNISYGVSSRAYDNVVTANENQFSSFPLTGLANATRYFIAVSAVDTSDNESENSSEIIVDTLPDTQPPFAPAGITGELSGTREITVHVEGGNENMVDFAGHIIYWGNAENTLDQSMDIGLADSHVFSDLDPESTWYFSAAAYDQSGNVSDPTPEVAVKMEDLNRFLDPNEFEGGCFINASAGADEDIWESLLIIPAVFMVLLGFSLCFVKSRRALIMVFIFCAAMFSASPAHAQDEFIFARKNVVGITGGYLIPNDSEFTDYYGNDLFPVYAFYQRWLSRHFSLDLEGGYMKENGNLRTVSGVATGIGTDITLVPVSASLKFNQRLLPFIVGYLGAGPDYWYVNEESNAAGAADREVNEWVGGYHGKAGFMFYNADEAFAGTGFMTEAVYSRIDRFGGNNTDVGGWTFRLGFFYQF